jgi:hypothetical protein
MSLLKKRAIFGKIKMKYQTMRSKDSFKADSTDSEGDILHFVVVQRLVTVEEILM